MSEQPTTQPDLMPGLSTQARALELLAELGDTAAQVAATLEAGGHTGRRGSSGRCPVAVYLLHSDLAITIAGVGDETIDLYFESDESGFDVEYIDTPQAAAEFIRAFDGGAFAQLVGEQS